MKSTSIALFFVISLLFFLGSLMVYNTTSAEVIGHLDDFSEYFGLKKHLFDGILGFVAAFIVYKIGSKQLVRKAHFLYLSMLFLLLYVAFFGVQINGARRWIYIAHVSLQPSEFFKWVLPLFYIYLFYKYPFSKNIFGFYITQMFFLIPIVLIMRQPDNGTALILLTTLVVLYFLTRVVFTYWVIPIIFVIIVGGFYAYKMPHVVDRIHIYLHPEADILGKGHQPYQAKIAAGAGGFLGRGVGKSLQKHQYLPEARSDYIAAIYAEEFGFLGVIILISLYMLVALLGFKIALEAKSDQGYYLASIYTFLITFQAFLNLGIVSGLLPSKGTNLPFFSQGGSSMLAHLMMIGAILSIDHEENKSEQR